MAANFLKIQDLLQQKADYQARLNLMASGVPAPANEPGI